MTCNEKLNEIAAQSMTVAQIIADLQRFPRDMKVVMHDGEYAEYSEIRHIRQEQCGDADVVYLSPFESRGDNA